eukprot:s505_g21.t1
MAAASPALAAGDAWRKALPSMSPEGRRPREEDLDQRRPKWQKLTNKGQTGKGYSSWAEWEAECPQESGMDSATIQLLWAITKLTLRHEEELSRVRVNTNFMLFVDVGGDHSVLQLLQKTAATWQDSFSAGTATTSLRVVLTRRHRASWRP